MTTEARYFIIETDDLTAYGSEDGMTKEEAVATLEQLEDDERNSMAVILGVVVKPKMKVKVTL